VRVDGVGRIVPMTDAKALVSAFADALERRDWPAFTALLDPDVVYERPYAPSSPRW
jgi:ketosteroid isomerase-like protein